MTNRRASADQKRPVQLRLACRGSVTTGARFNSALGLGEPMGTAGSAVRVAAESAAGAIR